ncbi:hypothetical protein AAFF_G00188800 [Aldrovandia affinis]|uniref:Uncharacterized protein n=1 Tax=Aldrovandia affinis TaxID=143900 RepID=A0AAD7WVX3_9TELE|nr:hypothetical protein AAFF_G00188800 [Aldrovandia affinis]
MDALAMMQGLRSRLGKRPRGFVTASRHRVENTAVARAVEDRAAFAPRQLIGRTIAVMRDGRGGKQTPPRLKTEEGFLD